MKGDITTAWEQYLTQQFSSLTLPITLCTGVTAEWRFSHLSHETRGTHPYLGAIFFCYYTYHKLTHRRVSVRSIDRWIREYDSPNIYKIFPSLPRTFGDICVYWEFLYDDGLSRNFHLEAYVSTAYIHARHYYPPLVDTMPVKEGTP
jgi:hypothetical protein